jgi:glycosyltransferase involved in cell wall biosynthesis
MRAMICLPTYNERDNLEPMVRALGEQIDTGRDRVLVIDDNSPDGTGAIADGLVAELPWVEVLHRQAKEAREGVLAGFHHALAAAPSSCSRSTATSPTTRRRCLPDRDLRHRRRHRPRLALGGGRRHRQLG